MVVEVVELFGAVVGAGATLVVDAWTSVSGELSLILADGAAGSAGAVAGFAWESVVAARDFGAGAEELFCASERVMAPSNAAVPKIKCLKRLNIDVNGKLKNAEAFKAGSRPAPAVRGSDILELEETVLGRGRAATGMARLEAARCCDKRIQKPVGLRWRED